MDRRDDMCVQLIKDISDPEHKFIIFWVLPNKISQIKQRQRETRSNGAKYYNFPCKSERLNKAQLIQFKIIKVYIMYS
jgi:hypothetical protein